jgi:hypothetical protein
MSLSFGITSRSVVLMSTSERPLAPVDTDNPVSIVAAIGVLEHELALLDPMLWMARGRREQCAAALRVARAEAWLRARREGKRPQADVQASVDLSVAAVAEADGVANVALTRLLDRQKLLERRLSALQSVLRTHSQISA